jgi:membrane associated rhomboid family serine protease
MSRWGDEEREHPGEPFFLADKTVIVFASVFVVIHGLLWAAPEAWRAYAIYFGQLWPGGFFQPHWQDVALSFANLFTHAFLHRDWMHVGFNAVFILAAAGPVHKAAGTRGLLLFFLVCVLAGALAHLALVGAHNAICPWWNASFAPQSVCIQTDSRLVGASAGASGLIAAAIRYRFADSYAGETVAPVFRKQVAMVSAVFIGMNLALFAWDASSIGAASGIAAIPHIAGYLAGLFLAPSFVRRGRGRPMLRSVT